MIKTEFGNIEYTVGTLSHAANFWP